MGASGEVEDKKSVEGPHVGFTLEFRVHSECFQFRREKLVSPTFSESPARGKSSSISLRN